MTYDEIKETEKTITKQIENGKKQKESTGVTYHHAIIRLATFTP
jgi:hypothetical protein